MYTHYWAEQHSHRGNGTLLIQYYYTKPHDLIKSHNLALKLIDFLSREELFSYSYYSTAEVDRQLAGSPVGTDRSAAVAVVGIITATDRSGLSIYRGWPTLRQHNQLRRTFGRSQSCRVDRTGEERSRANRGDLRIIIGLHCIFHKYCNRWGSPQSERVNYQGHHNTTEYQVQTAQRDNNPDNVRGHRRVFEPSSSGNQTGLDIIRIQNSSVISSVAYYVVVLLIWPLVVVNYLVLSMSMIASRR